MHRTDGQVGPAEAQAAKLRGILESAVIAIITIDDRGLIESVNPATERLFGYGAAELVGRNVNVLMPDPYRAEHDGYIHNYLKTGIRKIIGIGREVSGRRKDGGTFPIHLAVSEFEAKGRCYFTGMIHDLSDRKHVEVALRESERRLAQAQKMEAVGQLTGGIAHDFNNLLLVITGNLELLETRVDGDDARALLKEAQNAAVLGAQLTEQLLTFARQRQLDPRVVCLNDLVIGVADMLRRTLGEQIVLSTSLARDLWETCADPCQLQSAIVNLAVNARDAMPKGGRLIVETRNVTVEVDRTRRRPRAQVWRLRAAVGIRYRDGHAARGAGSGVRAFLYNQGEGPRHGARPGDGLWIRKANGRPCKHLQRGWSGDDGQPIPAAGGRPAG